MDIWLVGWLDGWMDGSLMCTGVRKGKERKEDQKPDRVRVFIDLFIYSRKTLKKNVARSCVIDKGILHHLLCAFCSIHSINIHCPPIGTFIKEDRGGGGGRKTQSPCLTRSYRIVMFENRQRPSFPNGIELGSSDLHTCLVYESPARTSLNPPPKRNNLSILATRFIHPSYSKPRSLDRLCFFVCSVPCNCHKPASSFSFPSLPACIDLPSQSLVTNM